MLAMGGLGGEFLPRAEAPQAPDLLTAAGGDARGSHELSAAVSEQPPPERASDPCRAALRRPSCIGFLDGAGSAHTHARPRRAPPPRLPPAVHRPARRGA